MCVLTVCVCLGRGWRMGRRLYNTGLSGTLPEGVGGLTSLQYMCVMGGGRVTGGGTEGWGRSLAREREDQREWRG